MSWKIIFLITLSFLFFSNDKIAQKKKFSGKGRRQSSSVFHFHCVFRSSHWAFNRKDTWLESSFVEKLWIILAKLLSKFFVNWSINAFHDLVDEIVNSIQQIFFSVFSIILIAVTIHIFLRLFPAQSIESVIDQAHFRLSRKHAETKEFLNNVSTSSSYFVGVSLDSLTSW